MNEIELAVWSAAFAASIQASRAQGRAASDWEFRAFADAWQAINILRAGMSEGRDVPAHSGAS